MWTLVGLFGGRATEQEAQPIKERWALPEVRHVWRPTLEHDIGHCFTAATEIHFASTTGGQSTQPPNWNMRKVGGELPRRMRAFDPARMT